MIIIEFNKFLLKHGDPFCISTIARTWALLMFTAAKKPVVKMALYEEIWQPAPRGKERRVG